MTQADRPITELDGAISCDLLGGDKVLFTTRAGGNLSTLRGDGHKNGRRARDGLSEALQLQWLCAGRQVHGKVVQRVYTAAGTAGEAAAIDADGHATALPGIGMMVLTADCLPVALGSAAGVAMLHAGWRGLAAGVLEEGVRALHEVGGRARIVAVVGPGAGACCYEVGPEVHQALGQGSGAGGNIDLRAIARRRLLAAGVAEVSDVEVCTVCDRRFFSHRREGAAAGRQAGVAWLS